MLLSPNEAVITEIIRCLWKNSLLPSPKSKNPLPDLPWETFPANAQDSFSKHLPTVKTNKSSQDELVILQQRWLEKSHSESFWEGELSKGILFP